MNELKPLDYRAVTPMLLYRMAGSPPPTMNPLDVVRRVRDFAYIHAFDALADQPRPALLTLAIGQTALYILVEVGQLSDTAQSQLRDLSPLAACRLIVELLADELGKPSETAESRHDKVALALALVSRFTPAEVTHA